MVSGQVVGGVGDVVVGLGTEQCRRSPPLTHPGEVLRVRLARAAGPVLLAAPDELLQREGATERVRIEHHHLAYMHALHAEQQTRTHAFRTRRPFRPEEGMELNVWWNGSLRRVFSADQYRQYVNLWSSGGSRVANAQPATVSVDPFHSQEESILESLGLSEAQWKKVRALQSWLKGRY